MFLNTLTKVFQTTSPKSGNRKKADRLNQRTLRLENLESRELMAVVSNGGPVMPKVEVQALYLGAEWKNNAQDNLQARQMDSFLNNVTKSTFMDMLQNAGYGVGEGSTDAGQIFAPDNVHQHVGQGTSDALTDATIQIDLAAAIAHNIVKTPIQNGVSDPNRLYIVYVEPNVVIQAGDETSAKDFAGYHNNFFLNIAGNVTDIRYAVIPYLNGPNDNYAKLGPGFNSAFDAMTEVTTHELAESVTDPDGNGWRDSSVKAPENEIGDLANFQVVSLNGYAVQEEVNKADVPMAPKGAVSYGSVSTPSTAVASLNETSLNISPTVTKFLTGLISETFPTSGASNAGSASATTAKTSTAASIDDFFAEFSAQPMNSVLDSL